MSSIKNYGKKMIFVVNDTKYNGIPNSRHNYLIIADESELSVNPYGKVQAVCITSMANKDISGMIPILMNDTVSYINPYQLHMICPQDFWLDKFHGILADDVISSDDMINLIKGMFMIGNNMSDERHTKMITMKYNEYVDQFFSKYSDKTEYRDVKVNKKMTIEIPETVKEAVAEEKQVSIETSKTTTSTDVPDIKKVQKVLFFNSTGKLKILSKWTDNELFQYLEANEKYGGKYIMKLFGFKNMQSVYTKTWAVQKEIETRGLKR